MFHKRSSGRPSRGFTIVEVITVIALMLVVIYPLARVVASSLEASNDENYLTHCAFLAVLKVEEVRTRANCYTDQAGGCPIGGNTSDFGANFDESAPCNFPAPFQRYECWVDHLPNRPGTGNRVRGIQVRVWYDKNDDDVFDPAAGEPDVFFETQIHMRPPDW